MSASGDPNDSHDSDKSSSPNGGQKPASPVPDLTGVLVGNRYLIERELARGGFGAVYLARDKPELMSRLVVVKVLLEKSLNDDWIVRKFKQEIESLARLDDPGVVGIFDAGALDDGTPYLVMQFVDGMSLRAEIKPGGMDFKRAANVMRQVGRTLEVAHEKGIIHRDLKPENIMLRHSGDGEVQVKVIDFGIAKVKNSVVAPSTPTGEGGAGTPIYMSPEQLCGQRVTPASDVYALGVIIYEMLTGALPFNPETAYQLLVMQQEGVRVPPKNLRPALPGAAQRVLHKALAFEPKDRYQRAREFGDAMARALLGEAEISEDPVLNLPQEQAAPRGGDRPPSAPAVKTPEGARREQATELATVLYTDIVDYANLPIDYQAKALRRLQEIVRNTAEFARAQADGQLICFPTGDGMALVFFGDPEAPVRCALAISESLKGRSEIQLRMGLHCGPVSQVVDVDGSVNVAGGGINIAQGVTDCGDAGHILLSKRVADDLGQYSSWRQHLHDLGEVEVKQGVHIHIVNLYTGGLGNPELPEKLTKRKRPAAYAITLAVALLAVVIVGVWTLWGRQSVKTTTEDSEAGLAVPAAERVFTYFLTPPDKGKSIEEERFTGNEQFRNGSKFRFVMIPEQSGALYLINQGAGARQTESWNVLFPTPKNNNGSSHVEANQRMEARINFDTYPGSEQLSIIWAARPVPELEAIFMEAADTDFEIKDPARVATVKTFLAKYDSPEPRVEVQTDKNQTVVRGGGEIVIRKITLKHFEF